MFNKIGFAQEKGMKKWVSTNYLSHFLCCMFLNGSTKEEKCLQVGQHCIRDNKQPFPVYLLLKAQTKNKGLIVIAAASHDVLACGLQTL
jgi:hypothetical protein